MRRFVLIVLVFTMILSLAACGDTVEPTSGPSASEDVVASAEPSTAPSAAASVAPSEEPSDEPSDMPTAAPSDEPTVTLSVETASISEVNDVADIEMRYPQIVCPAAPSIAEGANSSIADKIERIRADFDEMCEDASPDFGRWGSYSDYEVTWQSDSALSIRMAYSDYTGGAHPSQTSECFNFRSDKGLVAAHELLGVSTAAFRTAVLGSVAEQAADREGLYDDAASLAADYFSEDICALTRDGVSVMYDAYMIAPYAAGPQEFIVPYDLVGGGPDGHNG